MAKESVAAKLKALQKKWKSATPKTGGGLSDGDYEGVIKSGVIKSCKDGELQCVWEIEVTAPEGFEGRKQNKFVYLGGENSLEWFKGDLMALGIDPPDDMDDVPDAVGQSEGLAVAFRVRTKQENTNVYFIGLLEGEGTDATDTKDKDKEAEENEAETLTAKEVKALGRAEDETGLQAIIDDCKLGIDQDEYATYPEVADLIIEQLEL